MPDDPAREAPDRAPGQEPPQPEERSGGPGATAPGLAVGEDHDALDDAPEPNEPA